MIAPVSHELTVSLSPLYRWVVLVPITPLWAELNTSNIWCNCLLKNLLWTSSNFSITMFMENLAVLNNFYQYRNEAVWNLVNFLKPFQANVPFLYHLQTSEKQKFSNIFKGVEKWNFVWNELILVYLISLTGNFYFT